VEGQAPPSSTTQEILDGELGPEQRTPAASSEKLMERIVQFGVLLTPESARTIGQWLIAKADEFDALTREEMAPGEAVEEETDVVAS
jgi:hypothetical protein